MGCLRGAVLMSAVAALLLVSTSLADGRRRRRVIVDRVGKHPFLQQMAEPCKFPPITLDDYDEDNSLRIVARNGFIRTIQTTLMELTSFVENIELPDCNGLQLITKLPEVPNPNELSDSQFNKELYKALLLSTAYMNYMILDQQNATKPCLPGALFYAEQVERLGSKMDYVLCMAVQMMPKENMKPILREVSRMKLYHHNDCSGRLMRDCVVLHHTVRFFSEIENYFLLNSATHNNGISPVTDEEKRRRRSILYK